MNTFLLYVMAALYIAAGIFHFIRPRFYLKIMPPWIPWHKPIVFLSGVLEIVLGGLLFIESTQSFAAWGIIILLILIFPANIQMMLNYRRKKHRLLWITIARLPLQLLLIAWAWQYT
jgi:uncharacterized membrane protein